MRYQGALIPNSDITIIYEGVPPAGWDWSSPCEMSIQSFPTGANFTFVPIPESDNNSIWLFKTDTLGDYEFSAVATAEHPYGYEYGYDDIFESLDLTIAELPPNPITQTHTLVDNEQGSCSDVGVLVESNVPFNKINDVAITSTLTYLLIKDRQSDLMVTIEATDTDSGTSSLLNQDYAPYMGDITSWGEYLEVEVTLGVTPNEYTYNFGGGYQSLNKFSYPSEGIYTIYVKDRYGCIKQLNHEAFALPDVDPNDVSDEFYVSKANSFRFVKRETFDDCSIYKKDENTFDSELDGFDLTYCYKQRFKKCVDLISQIKSSYEVHTADYYNLTTGAAAVNMPVTMVQENLGITDLRYYLRTDDTLYSYIYFDDGVVPYFYDIGGIITINGISTQILGLSELEEENAIAIKVALLTFSSNPGQISYIFNRQNYNVYEFTFPASTSPDGEFMIELNATKTGSDPIKYQTPTFFVDANYERTFDIMYYNESNTDMYYKSGIRNFITVGYDFRKPVTDTTLTVVKADYSNFLTSSFNVEKFEVKFEPMTLEIMRKLVISLCHEKLFLDSVGYSVDDISLETLDDDTNLYVVTAMMNKSNFNVKFVSTGANTFDWSSGQVTFDNSVTFDSTVYNG